MKISAIVPAYNAQCFLPRAVGSLLATGYPKLEILLVEDGSSDNTLAVAQALQAAHLEQVRVLRHLGGGNRGVSASRNLGIANATGDLVCFLDADDQVLSHRFARSVQLLRDQSDVDGVYDATRISVDGNLANSGLGSTDSEHALFSLSTPHHGHELLRQLLRGYPWATHAIICRRGLFDRTGQFDESLHIAEDCNLWFRFAALGRIVPGDLSQPVALYMRHSGNTYTYSIERKLDMLRAMFRAWRTIRRNSEPAVSHVFETGMTDYLRNTIVVAREVHRLDVAWSALRLCIAEGSGVLLFKQSLMLQTVWVMRESLMRNSRAARAEGGPVQNVDQ